MVSLGGSSEEGLRHCSKHCENGNSSNPGDKASHFSEATTGAGSRNALKGDSPDSRLALIEGLADNCRSTVPSCTGAASALPCWPSPCFGSSKATRYRELLDAQPQLRTCRSASLIACRTSLKAPDWGTGNARLSSSATIARLLGGCSPRSYWINLESCMGAT